MRRSLAPSSRTQPAVADLLNSAENHVKELKKTVITVKKPENPEEEQKENTDTIIFTVVWGKQTTKKHKTFEGDGTLQIRSGKAVLKDEQGKYLGSSTVKLESLEEGTRLTISGNEVELIERQNKRKSPNKVIQPSAKRQKVPFKSSAASSSATAPQSSAITTDVKEPDDQQNDVPIVYNVVWAKPSSKKHKTWEGDGTVEILNRKVTLKDLSGNVLGTIHNAKTEGMQEGSHLFIENKEVELIELISSKEKSTVEKQPVPKPVFKLPKKQVVSTSAIAVEDDDFALVLPEPPYEHQWKYNTTKAPIREVKVCCSLAKHLRPHQREGVKFMYECVMGYRNVQPTDEYFGCILGDEMGLGKTLQCISVLYTLLKQGPYGTNMAKRIMIVTPSSLVSNWDNEINKWLHQERVFTYIIDGKQKAKKFAQSPHIPILLVSYEMFVNQFKELQAIKFDVIVCDEAHRLKNQGIKAATLLSQLECQRRILLTGTPIQNDLQEFHSLINFCNSGVLGSYQEFRTKYEIPIVQSQQPNTLPQFREVGEQRAKELNDITAGFVLRRTQEYLTQYLPKKQELVLFVRPTELQQLLLTKALEFYENRFDVLLSKNFTALQMITLLKKICNHPSLIRKLDVKESEVDEVTKSLCTHLPSWQEMGPEDSSKLSLVLALLHELSARREKVVLVTYFTKTLDMLQGACEHLNYQFCRLDGTTPSMERSKIVKAFNDPESETFVFLLSAKAGGIGLNLIGASRLVLFDNDWNPSSDLQAMSRIWRDGQTKEVYIYRLITAGTIEEKIFQRQMAKTSLSGCVVDLKQNLKSMKLSDAELKDLFSIDTEFEKCATHEMLDCDCCENGDIPDGGSNSSSGDLLSPQRSFRLDLNSKKKKKVKHALRMHELNKWEHHSGVNVSEELLQVGLYILGNRCLIQLLLLTLVKFTGIVHSRGQRQHCFLVSQSKR
jgi:DNA repair and recombination protein RAD54B